MTKILRMPIPDFVAQLAAALARGDGYIMGATGQDPRKWATGSWWFTQYDGSKRTKALYWREHAPRVWDCNGLAEGIYKDFSGVDINTYARTNYATWCGVKGKGAVPAAYRVPGTAVFCGSTAANIHHVAYLYKPVRAGHPEGDWYIIEARGVMYGVVQTRLEQRAPGYWGLMDKYFDYSAVLASSAAEASAAASHLGGHILKNGCEGEDVRELQTLLISLGYDCGRWGTDGDFGDATEGAVLAFQRDHGLEADGEVGPLTTAALEAATAAAKRAAIQQAASGARVVRIVDGQCFVRSAPNTSGAKLGVAREGDTLPYGGETSPDGWLRVAYNGADAWVSGLYGRLST